MIAKPQLGSTSAKLTQIARISHILSKFCVIHFQTFGSLLIVMQIENRLNVLLPNLIYKLAINNHLIDKGMVKLDDIKHGE